MLDFLRDLNREQKEAVTTTEGPLLIIAGAGTGKTTVIARRIAYIIEKKLAKPSEILALTFTEKAAAEMEERVDILVPYGFIDTWISTFHAFGDRILRENALDIGLSPDFKVLSRPQQVLFFQQNLFRFDLNYFRPLSNPTKFISAILSFFSRLKDENVTPKDFLAYVKKKKTKAKGKEEKQEVQKYQELADCFAMYEQLKSAAGFLDFGDQVVGTIDLFKIRPAILRHYREQFRYVLVDEYQDTNYAQNELVTMISGKKGNICVVGDDDQSIYKFRGASISNILQFRKNFPAASQVVLTQNYRSTQAILDSAYRLIRNNNPDRLEFDGKIDKKLMAVGRAGVAPREIFADTISEEADAVIGEIARLFKSKKYQYRDFAILVRANSQADHFLRSLNTHVIPHKFVGSSGLYSQPEVGTLISFLTAITNFEDSLNLYNLITSDIYELPLLDAIALASYARRKTRSLFHILKNLQNIDASGLAISEEGKVIAGGVVLDLEEAIKLSRKESVGRVTYNFLKTTGYLKRLEKVGGVEEQIKVQNIAKFFDKIKEFSQVAVVASPQQFVAYLEALRGAGDDPATVEFDPDLDAVNVMTVHGAKGLEFPVVFMVGLTSERFPSRLRSEPIVMPQALIKETLPVGDWHIQEERRLFYVGMTRARDLLFVSWSRDVGTDRARKISPFILEALGKTKQEALTTRLSPLEKIEKFAPVPTRSRQTALFDVEVLKVTQGSIDDYLTCAYKYRYVHVLKVPILRHHAIAYGAALHAAVAQFLRQKARGADMTLAQLLAVFDKVWDSEGFLTAEHEQKRKEQGKKALSAFWKRESHSPAVPTLIESRFRFSLKNVNVVGRFDRVDVKPGNKVTIIDYKSSENMTKERAEAQAKESKQLAIYALYWWKKHRILPEKLTLHFLENGIEGSFAPDQNNLKKTEELLIATAEKIARDTHNNSFAANPIYFGREPACVYCAYNSICPFSLAKI